MKQLYPAFVLIVLSIACASCGIDREPLGTPGRCELHGSYLHASIVRVEYGYAFPLRTHPGKEAFPNARHSASGGCGKGKPFRLEYNCSKCNWARFRYTVLHKRDPGKRSN